MSERIIHGFRNSKCAEWTKNICIQYDDDDGVFLSLGTNIIGYDVFLLLLSLAINV